MAVAAFLPAPIARITVAAPVTASPPAYTAFLEVLPVLSSITIPPLLLTNKSSVVFLINGLGLVPIEIITASTSISYSEFAILMVKF